MVQSLVRCIVALAVLVAMIVECLQVAFAVLDVLDITSKLGGDVLEPLD